MAGKLSKLSGFKPEDIVAPGVDIDTLGDTTELLKEMEAEWEKDWAEIDDP
jgi:hypothetical protein